MGESLPTIQYQASQSIRPLISFQGLTCRLQQSSCLINYSCQFTYRVAITPGVYSDGLAQFTDLWDVPPVRN